MSQLPAADPTSADDPPADVRARPSAALADDYPRPVQLAADAVRKVVPARTWPRLVGLMRTWRYAGSGAFCPCCERSFGSLRHHRAVPDIRCPACGSLERHRLLTLYFQQHPELLRPGTRLLHFAPEYCLMMLFERQAGIEYLTADLDSPLADDEVDITALPYEDERFDLLLCSHVLEHVVDDHLAMEELGRVLKPGGQALVLTPVDRARSVTDEDPTVTDPIERLERFGQEDHFRIYGRDLETRLASAGFSVQVLEFAAALPKSTVEEMRLQSDEEIYVCTKPRHP